MFCRCNCDLFSCHGIVIGGRGLGVGGLVQPVAEVGQTADVARHSATGGEVLCVDTEMPGDVPPSAAFKFIAVRGGTAMVTATDEIVWTRCTVANKPCEGVRERASEERREGGREKEREKYHFVHVR